MSKMSVYTPSVSLCVVALLFFCCISWKHSIIGVRDAIFLAGRTFLLLCFIPLASYFYPRMKALLFPPPPRPQLEEPEDPDTKLKQETARLEQQAKLNKKASDYQEHVQKPKQETLQRKKEEHFYRMTGAAWRLTEGETVGDGESCDQEEVHEEEGETVQQRAIRRRKLPAMDHQPVQKDPPLAKRVIVLPDEPPADAEGIVNVALRCLSGRTVYRRFLKSHPSTVLVDWMWKTGYHPTIYAVCTPYPRKLLQTEAHLTLEDVGIVHHTVLNVEEKDPSTT